MAATGATMTVAVRAGTTGAASVERLAGLFHDCDAILRNFLRRRVRHTDDADDLAQEVYLRVARHPQLDEVGCLRAFMFQTALNLVRDRSRRSYTRAQPRSLPIEDANLQSPEDPVAAVIWCEELERVSGAVDRMPPNRREALLLHRFDDRSYAEIAQQLNVSVSMVEKHISAALVDLRSAIQDSRNQRLSTGSSVSSITATANTAAPIHRKKAAYAGAASSTSRPGRCIGAAVRAMSPAR